jgi:bifunctional non-homologous end joining protein LigD
VSLRKYQSKRSFEKTPEPAGKLTKGGQTLRFVVQKHAASRLHYDFRLELDGVLKSWAVPKGPSLDPEDKRLALMVEDHPFDYLRFEGHIPEGNYGAGDVIVWDIGHYWDEHGSMRKPGVDALRSGLKEGRLKIHLKGRKLSGLFNLVRINSAEENAWLLIKHDDEHASTKDVLSDDSSAISKKKLRDPEPRERARRNQESSSKSESGAHAAEQYATVEPAKSETARRQVRG